MKLEGERVDVMVTLMVGDKEAVILADALTDCVDESVGVMEAVLQADVVEESEGLALKVALVQREIVGEVVVLGDGEIEGELDTLRDPLPHALAERETDVVMLPVWQPEELAEAAEERDGEKLAMEAEPLSELMVL